MALLVVLDASDDCPHRGEVHLGWGSQLRVDLDRLRIAGTAQLTLENGEQLDLSCDRSDGVVPHVRSYTAVECIGTARLGDRVGMSNLEVCTNPTGSNRPPVYALGANAGEGFSWRS